MQKGIRINESQLLYLASKGRAENTVSGYLHKKSNDTGKWQLRWFSLYQNLLFYYENYQAQRPSGVALLEGCYCERQVTPTDKNKDGSKQWGTSKFLAVSKNALEVEIGCLKFLGVGDSNKSNGTNGLVFEYCFTISYRKDAQQRQYDLKADSDSECTAWIDAIRQASYSKVLEQKEQLEQKHLHLLQILDSERQAKWHYVQQTEELTAEVKKLKTELREYKRERKISNDKLEDESEELRKIKKVQSFFRGWLCRRRWKQIVDEYIRSDHAESMRKRNSIVFGMVECEEEYVKQLSALVTVFLRPLKMAASSKKPPISHEDVNSIFLNSETVLFLHQIFLKGLMARMENWPTLVLGDLFDMLLPMLGIYQEYVRNHHYSLQVLAECKQRPEFNQLLRRYEEKSICEGRSLETFLTYPMHQIPRYIITIHELLAHTPHDHVERKSLEFAQSKLEELSQIMQDEVSETENIRKNLAIERMIVEGCDILLDVNQTFVRQGTLLQVIIDKPKGGRGRLGSFSSTFKESKKEMVRQCFLFTNHLLLTTRASNGRLHLAKHYGKLHLIECTLVEDSTSDVFFFDDDTSSLDSSLSLGSGSSANLLSTALCEKENKIDYNGLDFRIILDSKSGSGPPVTVILVASTLQEKAAWCSDIGQCIENLHYSDLLNSSMSETSSVTMPQSVRSDPKLFRDDVDIKFSRTLNSCKVPQIRHASTDRLLDRLTDLRFLSIDFLNTFLLTYRVFTTGHTVLEALKRVYRNPEYGNLDCGSSMDIHGRHSFDTEAEPASPPPHQVEFRASLPTTNKHLVKPQVEKLRRISTGSMKIEVTGEKTSLDSPVTSFKKCKQVYFESDEPQHSERGHGGLGRSTGLQGFTKGPSPLAKQGSNSSLDEPQTTTLLIPTKQKLAPIASCETLSNEFLTEVTESEESSESPDDADSLHHASGAVSGRTCISFSSVPGESSTDSPVEALKVPTSPSMGASSETLVGSLNSPVALSTCVSSDTLVPGSPHSSPSSPLASPKKSMLTTSLSMSPGRKLGFKTKKFNAPPIKIPTSSQMDALALSPATSPKFGRAPSPIRRSTSPAAVTISTPGGKRGSADSEVSSAFSPRSSLATTAEGSPPTAKAGTVVTSSRASKRRSSSTAATAAFAAATAGSANPKDHPKGISRYHSAGPGDLKPNVLNKKRESVISTAATMRVLNVLRHWVSKHTQDFEADAELKKGVKDLLEEMVCNTNLLPAEHKAAASILRVLTKDDDVQTTKVDLDELLRPPTVDLEDLLREPATPTKDNFDTLSALDIAEQLTYLDHQIFMAIRSDELLCQAWMKPDKSNKAPHVLLVSKRFNEVSRLVVSEVVRRQNMQDRVACIEKWAAIADICRCMHNYNGVLQICAAFVNSSVYRLKKTWEKLSKQTKQMIERLQTLVSSDGRFRNMRDALHRSDPPCIPYLGMYLTDLSFIEEGTPNQTDDGLINFSKMRMIAHVIREIQLFQQTPYRIEHHKRITNYLLDPSRLLGDEETYRASLEIEPRQPRVSMSQQAQQSS